MFKRALRKLIQGVEAAYGGLHPAPTSDVYGYIVLGKRPLALCLPTSSGFPDAPPAGVLAYSTLEKATTFTTEEAAHAAIGRSADYAKQHSYTAWECDTLRVFPVMRVK